LNHQGCWLSS